MRLFKNMNVPLPAGNEPAQQGRRHRKERRGKDPPAPPPVVRTLKGPSSRNLALTGQVLARPANKAAKAAFLAPWASQERRP